MSLKQPAACARDKFASGLKAISGGQTDHNRNTIRRSSDKEKCTAIGHPNDLKLSLRGLCQAIRINFEGKLIWGLGDGAQSKKSQR